MPCSRILDGCQIPRTLHRPCDVQYEELFSTSNLGYYTLRRSCKARTEVALQYAPDAASILAHQVDEACKVECLADGITSEHLKYPVKYTGALVIRRRLGLTVLVDERKNQGGCRYIHIFLQTALMQDGRVTLTETGRHNMCLSI